MTLSGFMERKVTVLDQLGEERQNVALIYGT